MKLYKQDLLTLLISLFIFTGCQNPDSIGLDVDPQNAIEGKLIDTLTLRTRTVKEDSLSTASLTKYPLGYFADPVFGITDSRIAATLTLPAEALTFATSPVLDSAVLVLKYADEYTGEANSQLMMEVAQLNERLTINSNYFSNADHPASATIIGSRLAKVNLKDSVTITVPVKGKADITQKRAPQVRIPINASFVQNNFFNADIANFKDNSAFNDFIKGLQIKVNKGLTTGSGGLATFDLTDTLSRLELYYHKQTGTAIDTVLTTFKINPAYTAATVIHNYNGTAVQTQLNAPATASFNVTYIQPLGGVKTEITFPYIQNLKALGNITINKAELVVQVEIGSDIFSPAPRIYMYRTDIADQRQVLPDVALGLSDLALGGFYDSTKKQYRFTLTTYMQHLLSGRLKQYKTFITAVDSKATAQSALFPAGNTVSRAILGSDSSSSATKMKLNIIYTKAN
jgi:hypothetical protein